MPQPILFLTYRASLISAKQILLVRSGRVVELQLRGLLGNLGRSILQGRD